MSRLLRLTNFTLENRIAIVTGAGQGMGEAFARILALNGAGVVVCDLNAATANKVATEIVSAGAKAIGLKADVSDYEEVSKLVENAKRVFGSPDILINNAGILKPTSFQKIAEPEWRSTMQVNIDGVYHCCKAVVPLMVEKSYGKIINMSSSAGKSSSTFGGVHYTASKAAVLGITRHLARELAPFNITVNAVCPGGIETPMVSGNATPEQIKAGISKIPLGRLGTVEEVANLILFLASDASSYITGASIDINGGELMV